MLTTQILRTRHIIRLQSTLLANRWYNVVSKTGSRSIHGHFTIVRTRSALSPSSRDHISTRMGIRHLQTDSRMQFTMLPLTESGQGNDEYVQWYQPQHFTDVPQTISLVNSASVCSTDVIQNIKRLEEATVEDLGNRGISSLLVNGDLLKASLSLSRSSSVALTTGFPLVNTESYNAENTHYYGETDGPMGVLAIAMMLKALGKDVTFVIDGGFMPTMNGIVASLVSEGMLQEPFPLIQYPLANSVDSAAAARAFLLSADDATPKFDHLLALERSGKAKDRRHYNMRGRDISDIGGMQATDSLFDVAATEMSGAVTTIAIGDGGNELGMGKVYDHVVADVPNGETIACVTGADYLITAGVSNWGGYAIAIAMYLLRMCPVFDKFNRHDVRPDLSEVDLKKLNDALPNVEREENLLRILMKHNVLDGVKGAIAMSIDGLPFRDTHANKIESLLSVIDQNKRRVVSG